MFQFMRNLLFLFVLCFWCHNLWASDHEGGFTLETNRRHVTLPIEVHNNLAVVRLYINETGPFSFILDTGVRTTILTEPMLAHLLDLEFDENIMIYGLGGDGYVLAAISRGVSININGITGENMNLIVIPDDILNFSEHFGFPVYGILGYDFFNQFPIEIDYQNERMRVYNDTEYRIRRKSIEVPFRLINGKPYLDASIISNKGDTLHTTLLIDLGASHPLYLNRRYISLSDKTMQSYIGKGISGNLIGEIGRVNKVLIGDIEINEPLVFYPDAEFLIFYDEEINWQGLIGGAILSRFNIIIDYSREKLVLRPNRSFKEPFKTNLSGIEVLASGTYLNQFKVHYVRPGSAAYEAGIVSGDRIIQLNHLTRHDLNMNDILDLLTNREGTRIVMVINRDGKTLRKEFRLREDLY